MNYWCVLYLIVFFPEAKVWKLQTLPVSNQNLNRTIAAWFGQLAYQLHLWDTHDYKLASLYNIICREVTNKRFFSNISCIKILVSRNIRAVALVYCKLYESS